MNDEIFGTFEIANVGDVLAGVPGLSADRVYFNHAQQGAPAPFAVWQVIVNNPGLVLAGKPKHDAQLFQVDVYSRDPSEARRLAFAARDALEGHAHVTRGPVPMGVDPVTELCRWQQDVSVMWMRSP